MTLTTPTLPTLLPVADAARKYGLSEEYIRALIQHGTIKAAMIGDEVVISESAAQEQARKPIRRKEDLPEYMKHAYLKGAEIGVGEAARKYTVPVSTLHGWATKGIVRIIRRDGQKVLLDEADVAYCAEIYRKRNGQGKWLFDEKGMPYKPKTGPLAI